MAEEFRCKVNLGRGVSGAKGWHNFDNSPTIWLSRVPLLRRWKRIPRWPSDVRHVDVIKGLPFEPETVDCIYSSHMIEHSTFGDAVKVLNHCRKVLRVGGVLRITVPDLRIMGDDYVANGDAARFVERLHLSSILVTCSIKVTAIGICTMLNISHFCLTRLVSLLPNRNNSRRVIFPSLERLNWSLAGLAVFTWKQQNC